MEVTLRARIAKAVNKADPEGLLKLGAPADEYGVEIDAIAAALEDVPLTEKAVAIVARNVFRKYFGHSAYTHDDFLTMAKEICSTQSFA